MSMEETPSTEEMPQPTGQALSADRVLPACTPRQKAFAARMALGDSMSGAARYAGIHRTTGYEWQELPQVQQEIARYGRIATDNARRMVVGQVGEAVRTVRRLMRDASHRGAPTQLAAAKLILDYNNIAAVPVGNQQTRILTYIPREERDDAADDPATLDVIEASYKEDALPLVPTKDGLPPDFPRQADERDGGYAQPSSTTPEELTDPAYYRKSLYDR